MCSALRQEHQEMLSPQSQFGDLGERLCGQGYPADAIRGDQQRSVVLSPLTSLSHLHPGLCYGADRYPQGMQRGEGTDLVISNV